MTVETVTTAKINTSLVVLEERKCCIKRKCYGTNDDCGLPSPSVPLHVPPSIPMICFEDKGINFVCYE